MEELEGKVGGDREEEEGELGNVRRGELKGTEARPQSTPTGGHSSPHPWSGARGNLGG